MCNVYFFHPSFGLQAGRGNDTGYETKTQPLLMRLLTTLLLIFSMISGTFAQAEPDRQIPDLSLTVFNTD